MEKHLVKKEFEVEVKLDKRIQSILERREFETYNINKVDIKNNEDIMFIKIDHISYDREKNSTDINLIDFQQILSAISSKSKKFIYMVDSDENGISLYLGTKDDKDTFLKDTFEGIYSGSKVENCERNTPRYKNMNHSKAMLGVPSLKRDSDKEYKQTLEKILFPMQGKKFRITIVAESYPVEVIQEIISNYQKVGNEIHKLTKRSLNEQKSNADTTGITLTDGTSNSETEGESESSSITGGISLSIPIPNLPIGVSVSKTESTTTNKSRTSSTNKSTSKNENTTKTQTYGITHDEISKSATYCEELIEKYIERFQKGLNQGMWNTSLYIQADDRVVLSELEHTLKSVYSGDETYFESIRFSNDLSTNKKINLSKYPMLYFDKSLEHIIDNSFASLSSAINTEELSILSALPNSDIDGISVSKISSFGLSQSKNINKYKSIEIGNILNKKKPTSQRFKLSFEALNSHLFVSGITGGGKSNTIKSILKKLQDEENIDKKIPFLVIEPAKSEYKNLLNDIEDLQIFRPGSKNDIFKFNPFIFEHSRKNQSVTLTKHVDMIKTTFSSAFPMYGPMPYILEDAIHLAYESKGWDFNTEDNKYFVDSEYADWDRKSLLFPNMNDLLEKVENVLTNSGYAQELHSNIKAALQTRIRNLTLGIKGRIFNSRHAFNSKILFEKPTIIELSNIVDDEEKAFLIGLILNKLYQYREEKGSFKELQHLTVIEEAHRLLPNISLNKSSEDASSKAKAVETFVNILSEIRSYGEGLVIADQIASKLHRDVIKNTNIKIVHRTMDYEDREILGKSINLDENQILDIAELKAGEAIVHNRDIHRAFMVQIDQNHEKDIGIKEINKFYENFIEQESIYRYEYINEHYFYLKYRLQINKFEQEQISKELLKFINSVFFDTKNINLNFKKLIDSIPLDIEDKKSYIYILIDCFLSFNYLSNIEYYKNIDGYLDVYKSFVELIKDCLDEEELCETTCESFKNNFLHKKLKVVYPSMKYYNNSSIDYSLLILENMTLNSEVLKYINTTMKKNLELYVKRNEILNKIFGTNSNDLENSFIAIRSNKEVINPNKVKKGGF